MTLMARTISQRRSSRVCVCFMCVCVCSQQPLPEKLQIRVNRISMAAYEALHYDKDQLKEACEC